MTHPRSSTGTTQLSDSAIKNRSRGGEFEEEEANLGMGEGGTKVSIAHLGRNGENLERELLLLFMFVFQFNQYSTQLLEIGRAHV